MIAEKIRDTLVKNLGFDPTQNQQEAIEKITSFLTQPNDQTLFLLRGYAGTGKTTMINSLVKTMDLMGRKSVLLAPTGRAAKVIQQKTKRQAFTIHKKIYQQKSSNDGFGSFTLSKNLHKNTYFIVDEASMIANQSMDKNVFGSGSLLDDLFRYVYNGNNCRLIVIGDTAQLPPVHYELSPALNKFELETFGKDVTEYELSEVIRQKKASGILKNATEIRKCIAEDNLANPSLYVNDYQDIIQVSGEELIDTLTNCYDKDGIENTMVISRSNKRCIQFNKGIRNQILWKEEEITAGDIIMVVKNNYFYPEKLKLDIDFIANGDIAEIVKIHGYQDLYDFRFADVTLRFLDYEHIEIQTKILLDTLNQESASMSTEENKRLYYNVLKDYPNKPKREQYKLIRKNEYFNALQVKFAYGITCHKSQGGEWDHVFIDQGYLTPEMMNKSYFRWLYTAITRSKKSIYLINFSSKLFTFR